MLTLIGRASSINVRKVLWTCDEIGLAYERVDAGPDLPTRKSAMHSDAALIAASVQQWNRLMTVLDQQLALA